MNNIDIKADIRCVKTKTRKIFRIITMLVYWIAIIISIFILGFYSDFKTISSIHDCETIYWRGIEICEKTYWHYPDRTSTLFNASGIFMMIITMLPIVALPFAVCFIKNALYKRICKNSLLSINNERVEGTYYKSGIFKKSFTFPIEQIVNIITLDRLKDKIRSGKTILLHTSSGKIKFSFVQNAEEISTAILNAVKEYKENYGIVGKRMNVESKNDTDEIEKIKKYKELMDSGVISQEEFEIKKREILNI